MFKPYRSTAAVALLLCLAATGAQAAQSAYFVDYSGADFNNAAVARGVLTMDDALFPAASNLVFLIPGEAITDFSLTVSGAASGNGTFGLGDYDSFAWSTTGDAVALDLNEELVGQPTLGGGWGTTFDGSTGDFNPFALAGSSAPSLTGAAFTIATANGAGDSLHLVSFRPVPVPAAAWLFGSALAGLAAAGRRRSRARAPAA